MSSLFRVFPNDPAPPFVDYADGVYVFTKSGKKLLDTTAGGTSYSILGWNHSEVNSAIQDQLKKFSHLDYKLWSDSHTEELAELLLSKAEHSLDRVYFSGNSGAEACEAAMKMSYQVHYDLGKPQKKWFISREQSYHGSTADALALGERPNLEFFRPMLSPFRARIPMHHPLYLQRNGETSDDYAKRSASELENKILEIGPDNVSGFVGETIMGGLVGDVPPAENYWQYIREVCTRYDVHLILDEVYCGTGTTGKIYCCDWDGIKPDFIFIGKTLAAGYGALSAVITSSEVESIIKNGQGRLQHTTTHQAHSLSVSAALAVQKIIHNDDFLSEIYSLGEYMRNTIIKELGDHPFFYDVRGRGMRFSFEYDCKEKNKFGHRLQLEMEQKHSILINAKWHRVCFTPALILGKTKANQVLETFISTFKDVARGF
ncbi:aminotransferase class III-fold pyridoxal phosphate-dependent enzyme [bacterium]|nr:aminotransferase class III-fold pyridoxal phosphate-dependent enzyme [bacterium]